MSTWVQGNSVDKWHAGFYYDYTAYPDRGVWTVRTCIESESWGFNIYGLYAKAYIGGGEATINDGSFYSPNGTSTWKELVSYTKTVYRTKSRQDVQLYGQVDNWGGFRNGSSSASYWDWLGPLESNTVSYNANGGSGAPVSATKWYNEHFYLSTTTPSRTGYTFQGWATSASGSVSYSPGQEYTADAAVTFYAVWKANTWTVSYNANGGSGAPGNQTKTYGVNLTLSSTKPTRTLYNFKGWSTSSSATTAQYASGATYTGNTAITLYAVWKLAYVYPIIESLNLFRCTSAGVSSEEGTYAKISFTWKTDRADPTIKIESAVEGSTSYTIQSNTTGSGKSGSVSLIIGANGFSTETSYGVRVTITDSVGFSQQSANIAAMNYIMDISPTGGVSFGAPAKAHYSKKMDAHITAVFYKGSMISTGEGDSGFGKPGWVRIIKITNTRAYVNSCISIRLIERSKAHPVDIHILFNNYHNTNLTVNGITAYTESPSYVGQLVYTVNANVFELWTKKDDPYDTPGITSLDNNYSFVAFDYDTTSIFSPSPLDNSKIVPVDGLWVDRQNPPSLLWSSALYMTEEQTASLTRAVSTTRYGIVLVWCGYDPSTNTKLSTIGRNNFFIPKTEILNSPGVMYSFFLSRGNATGPNGDDCWVGHKSVYISDNKIVGRKGNADSAVSCSINMYNEYFVLYQVWGV